MVFISCPEYLLTLEMFINRVFFGNSLDRQYLRVGGVDQSDFVTYRDVISNVFATR